MLNRRTLRIKVMQTIFALHTARDAEYNIALGKVKDNFLPDLNSMEEQDKEQLSKDRKTAGACFKNAFQNGMDNLDPDVSPDMVVVVSNCLTDYENQVADLKRSYKKRLISETKGVFDQYLQLLSLIPEIKRIFESSLKPDQKSNFISNKIIEGLNKSSEFESLLIKKNLTWQNEQSNIRTWVKEIIKKDEVFLKYESVSEPTFEEDLNLILYIYKSLVFKNETIKAYFEASDLGWTENSSVLKSMVLKTFKSIDEEENEPVIMELSKNWKDDLLFLENIFDYSVNNEEEYKEIVAEKSKNWEIDRVALTDKIILEMALAEMINFNSIPIKVSINEYIELSKLYSTPKSKQFINGLLDVLSEELKKEGKIKKSGRGLLDNK